MSVFVTRTKVSLPHRRGDLLSRQRLVDSLSDLLDYKLFLVVAPAGYGKTSLLVDYAHQSLMPVCWYALDELDRAPLRFLAHFIASINRCFPTFGSQSMSAIDLSYQPNLDFERLIAVIVNDIYEHIHEHFVIVLDDYHLLNGYPEIDGFINRFLQRMTDNCHLILASRTLLTLPDMTLLAARSQVGGLSFEEMAFTPEEVQALVLQNYHTVISAAIAEDLAWQTEGWVTGLLLTAQTLWRSAPDRLKAVRVSGVELYDYLAQQVLEQQPPEIQDFLLRSSFLGDFDTALCNAVLGESERWPDLIAAVVQSNLFVLTVGDQGQWIRYHHLFRDFLQTRFEHRQPGAVGALLRRVVDAYSERDEWEKAHAICLRLNEPTVTANLIERAASWLMKAGRRAMIVEWVDALPPDVLASRPNLMSLRGITAVLYGQVEQGCTLLDRAAEAQRAANDHAGLALTLVRRTYAYRTQGKYKESMNDAEESLSLSEDAPGLIHLQAEALKAIGLNCYLAGDNASAFENLSRSLAAYDEIGDKSNVAAVQAELATVYMSAGQFQKALSFYKQSSNHWRKVNHLYNLAGSLNDQGFLYHLMGDFEQAGAAYEEALSLAQGNGITRLAGYVICGIGDLFADLDASDEAMDAYNRAWVNAVQINDRFLMMYIAIAQSTRARQAGNLSSAWRYLETARQSADKGQSRYVRGFLHFETGLLELAEGSASRATESLRKAASLFSESGQRVRALRACFFLAAAQYAGGDVSTASASLGEAFRLASELEDQQVLVNAGFQAKPFLKAAQEIPAVAAQSVALFERVDRFEKEIPAIRKRLRRFVTSLQLPSPKLTIRLLGRAYVRLNGKPISAGEWQKQKRVRELFYFLLSHPDGETRERLADIFWPDSPPGQIKVQFKNAVYRLRVALGQEAVLFEDERYWFNTALDYEYDVEMFQQWLAEADAAPAGDAKITAYREAVKLYRGGFFPEGDGAWVLVERERLWQKFVAATLALSNLLLEAGEARQVLEHCQRLLGEDSCLEDAHRLAMRAYAALGDQGAVSRQYERCRQALQTELGVQPSGQTEYLFHALIHK